MKDVIEIIRTQLEVIDGICGDVEDDIEGLDAMAGEIKPRPAIAVINDLATLCGELRDALKFDGRKLTELLADGETKDGCEAAE